MERGNNAREHLAANVKRLLLEAGFKNQRQLSLASNVSPSQIKRICEGTIATSIDTLDALASALNVETWCLVIPPKQAGFSDRTTPAGRAARDLLRMFANTTPAGRKQLLDIAELLPVDRDDTID